MDKNKVIKGLEACAGTNADAFAEQTGCILDCPYKGMECVDNLMFDVLVLLKEQPEIVKCNDCAYAIFKEGLVQPGHIVCTKPFTENWQSVKPNNWFCADGTRKEI